MRSVFYKMAILSMLMLPVNMSLAHEDHAHDEKPGAKTSGVSQQLFIRYGQSQKYELTVKHGKLDAGKPAELLLYIADYFTNAPLSDVDIKVSVQEDPSIHISVDPHEPGVYHVDGVYPKDRAYALVFNLNSKTNGADAILVSGIEVGKEPPALHAASVEEVHDHDESTWWKYGLVLIAGIGLGYLLLRRHPKTAMMLCIGMLIPSTFQRADAHGDDDHGASQGGSVSGTEAFIPKETQFLYGIRTQQIMAGNFQPTIQFYGTIIPSDGGKVEITAPNAGRLISLRVKPGQRVGAGEVVAILRPTLSQNDQVSVVAETGRISADVGAARSELQAAEKEMNRLRSIEDIAAKKDVQAAEARYRSAKANLDALEQTSSRSAAISGTDLVLKSPVKGTVGQFTWAVGAEILAGTPLFAVTNLSKVYVEAQVYDRDAHQVNRAEKYMVTCTNDDHKSAEVKMISEAYEVNPSNQSQRVLFELTNPGEEFKIGEFVKLQAYQEKSDKAVFIPNSALSEINGKPVIFVKEGPEAYKVEFVSLGEDNGTHTVLRKGMTPGDRYITEGTYQVKMMMLNQ